jgi:OmpA-OmpF porin, OOP family
VSAKTGILLAALALLLLFIICPWMHWREIAAMQGGGTSVPAANTNTNANANVALGAPSFKVAFEGGKFRLTGTLPNEEAKKQIIAEATKTYGAGNFIDELKVGAVSNPSWLSSAIALIPFTKNGVTNGGLSAEGNSLTLRGEVPTQADSDRIYADARKALPNTTITNALTVAGQKALSDEQVKVQSKLNEQLAGKIVEFETASDQLTDKGKAVLDELAPILQGSTDKLEVGGHTDNAGNAARNQSLSQRRAETVKKYLTGKGLDANRFTTKGYGQTKPIAGTTDKQTDDEKARNRRIEFQVLGGGK